MKNLWDGETHGTMQKLDEGESNFARPHLLNLLKCDYAEWI